MPPQLIKEISEFIDRVTPNPHVFESSLNHILLTADNWMEETTQTPMEAAQKIVNESLFRPDFRYNGVRLCMHFIEDLKEESHRMSFHEALVKCCEDWISRTVDQDRPDNPQDYSESLALFVGDLYSRSGDADLGFSLLQLIQAIMKNPSDSRLKVCAQVLKLCGSYLTATENRDAVEQPLIPYLMEQMRSFCAKEQQESHDNATKNHHLGIDISPTTQDLMLNVVYLYDTNWGLMGQSAGGGVGDLLYDTTDPNAELTAEDYENMRCYVESLTDNEPPGQMNHHNYQNQSQTHDHHPDQQHQQYQEHDEYHEYIGGVHNSQHHPGYSFIENENGEPVLLGDLIDHQNPGPSAQYDFGECGEQDDDVAEAYERFLRESVLVTQPILARYLPTRSDSRHQNAIKAFLKAVSELSNPMSNEWTDTRSTNINHNNVRPFGRRQPSPLASDTYWQSDETHDTSFLDQLGLE
ncbi:Polyadenylate-binding protein-interacting protein 1 [Fragariocoptes setiger]|uniref:Polyadenylate-binding protein-interacting protein 1 n=1 Tax=Fragariocoptes setiger TaxID=1670756 RepID=A0ABQ7S5E3_9ACAR|nr:Polyadenylate-binding protein-interacting protein 1 [Fragariocoptes setiger]